MKVKKLLLIIGKSGTGKTTISQVLEDKYGVKSLKSYTTRPRRSEDECGHIFVSDGEYDDLKGKVGENINVRGYKYCSTRAQLKTSDVYVVDVTGAKKVKEAVENSTLTLDLNIVYLVTDKNVLKERLQHRENYEHCAEYEEIEFQNVNSLGVIRINTTNTTAEEVADMIAENKLCDIRKNPTPKNKYTLGDSKTIIIEGQRRKVTQVVNNSTGELGGWIEKPDNLSQMGSCWISEDVTLLGETSVSGDARVSGNLTIDGSLRINMNSMVKADGFINATGIISGNVYVDLEHIDVLGYLGITDNAIVKGRIKSLNRAMSRPTSINIVGRSVVDCNLINLHTLTIRGNAQVKGNVTSNGLCVVEDAVKIEGTHLIGDRHYKHTEHLKGDTRFEYSSTFIRNKRAAMV